MTKKKASDLEKGDVFKHAGKELIANEVKKSFEEVRITVSLGDSGEHNLCLPSNKEVEIVTASEED